MKIIRYAGRNGNDLGVLTRDESGVVSVRDILPGRAYADMQQLIEEIKGDDLTLLQMVPDGYEKYAVEKISDVKILAPIEHPIHDVLCVGVNYRAHSLETGAIREEKFDQPDPIFFGKRAIRILGDGDDVDFRDDIDPNLDYESELAVIIGKRCKDVAKADAESVIFGYSVFNDYSSRILQKKHVQWLRGKSLDTYTAMGPCIVYKEDIEFPPALKICSRLNGETRQDSTTDLLINDIPTLIETLSAGMTLEPGDIIATGTPSGVGMGMEPPEYMKHGDTIECEIEGIGILTNHIK